MESTITPLNAAERDGFSYGSGGPLGIYFWVEMIEIKKGGIGSEAKTHSNSGENQ